MLITVYHGLIHVTMNPKRNTDDNIYESMINPLISPRPTHQRGLFPPRCNEAMAETNLVLQYPLLRNQSQHGPGFFSGDVDGKQQLLQLQIQANPEASREVELRKSNHISSLFLSFLKGFSRRYQRTSEVDGKGGHEQHSHCCLANFRG